MDREQVRIAGLTGVEITLEVAGVGSRSFAFIIDWHIRVLAALAWFLMAALFAQGMHLKPATLGQIMGVPALAIYFLYHPILEMFTAGTPGKRMAGVRIVTRQGGTPSIGALLVRNLFRLIDSFPVFYLVGLLFCLFSEQRVRVGDMAAGTVLVLSDTERERSLRTLGAQLANTGLAPNVIELVNDLVQRWPWLDARARDDIARLVLVHVDASLSTETLVAMNDLELRRRLGALRAA
jgi:uncharacterized RDD family membrane protein YckC